MKRKLLLLVFICLTGIFLIGYFLLAISKNNTFDSQNRIQIAEFENNDIKEISYWFGNNCFTFYRTNASDTWNCSSIQNYPFDQRYVDRMVYQLSNITSTMRIDVIESDDYANLGFDNPTLNIMVTVFDGNVYELTVGSYNDLISRYYLSVSGDPDIHLIEMGFVNAFSYELNEMILLDIPPQFFTSAVTGFEIIADGKITRFDYYEDGKSDVYSNAIKWFISNENIIDYPAGTVYITNLLAYTGAGMEFERCVFYNTSQNDYSQFGLDNPTVISVNYIIDSVIKNVKYYIGDKTDEFYYLMYSDSDKVYLVRKEIAENIINNDPESFQTDAITLVKFETVDKLVISTYDEKYEFEVQRTINNTNDNESDKQSLYYMNGIEITKRKAEDFYLSLYHIDSEYTLSSPYIIANLPSVTIEFYRNTINFSYMILEFIPYNENFYIVRFNGRSDQLVGIRKVEMFINGIADMFY